MLFSVTEVQHNLTNELQLSIKCEPGGCSKYYVSYCATMAQIEELIKLSSTCTQFVKVN